jgi:hypothetical protein
MTVAHAGSLTTGDEQVYLGIRGGINEKVINIDHNNHRFPDEKAWIKFGWYQDLVIKVVQEKMEEVSRRLAETVDRFLDFEN